MLWKSTSLNGWLYLVVWKDFGSSLKYAIYALFNLLLFLLICLIMLGDNIIIDYIKYHETWIGWMVVHGINIGVSMGSNLDKKIQIYFLFAKISLAWRWKGRETLVDNGQGFLCLSSYHTPRNTKLESDQRGTPKNLLFLAKESKLWKFLHANFILNWFTC